MFIKFEDQTLHAAFIDQLNCAAVPYTIDANDAVNFTEAEHGAVTSAAHKVRDAQFRWYFLQWPTDSQSVRFRGVLEEAGLPFFVEYHHSGTWFLVRRADQTEIDRLSQAVDV
jgi:hypothetical protein